MKISILAVGTELLMGKTLNSNATVLSEKINETGHSVIQHLTIGDNPDRLVTALNYLFSFSDMVITTGGLGPTQDDLTKETIGKFLNAPLKKDEKAFEMMATRFKSYNRQMTPNNEKQAYLPLGCIPMYNNNGTAPGFILENEDKIIAALPGPPREMLPMYEETLLPYLNEKSDGVIVSEYINLFGIGESSAASLVDDLISEQSNPTIACYANIGQVSFRVTSAASSEAEAKMIMEPTIHELTHRLKDYIIGYGQKTLIDYTIDTLIEHKVTLSLAESCTGGMIASDLINYSGASAFLDRSLVTYSNEAKMALLDVKENTLKSYGAVSSETCDEMLDGLKKHTASDLVVAVTGIAGPTGGTPNKPVGLVYIGVDYKGHRVVKSYHFKANRLVMRQRTTLQALFLMKKIIENTL